MNKKLQVFVSSTFTDMLAERQAAVEAILRAGHIPAGMELFAAGDQSQLEIIRSWIDESDVFMLIVGGRYGSIETSSGKSYIQLEYEYAVSQRKPFFAAVIADNYLTKKVKDFGIDVIERTNGVLFNSFKETVVSKICRFYDDPNELKLIVFEALANHARNEDLSGWIRGKDAIDPKTALEDMTRLQAENRSLQQRVQDLESLKVIAERAVGSKAATSTLSVDAQQLLVAAKASSGYILYLRTMSGGLVQAGGKNFVNPSTSREEARWKGAIDDLVEHRLVVQAGGKGETFRVTREGYEAADRIEAERSRR